eukprot:Skav222238  [mRNA]  locus=scaffold3059:89441:89701:+ [translate_table: standard]
MVLEQLWVHSAASSQTVLGAALVQAMWMLRGQKSELRVPWSVEPDLSSLWRWTASPSQHGLAVELGFEHGVKTTWAPEGDLRSWKG